MSDQDKQPLIGADGLDLNNTAAVDTWIKEQMAEHESLEAEFAKQLKEHGVKEEDIENFDGNLKLDNLTGELKEELLKMKNEIEQHEGNFQDRLNKIDKDSSTSSGVDPARKWKAL